MMRLFYPNEVRNYLKNYLKMLKFVLIQENIVFHPQKRSEKN
uniref:Uncharacterized protein n=1 Tax=Meloidogyne enterolobii TaxID=390850 RepID=A0A6V7TZ00_MELEN|nr:unnamed protein product [Meloidogyne enterolobii]